MQIHLSKLELDKVDATQTTKTTTATRRDEIEEENKGERKGPWNSIQRDEFATLEKWIRTRTDKKVKYLVGVNHVIVFLNTVHK